MCYQWRFIIFSYHVVYLIASPCSASKNYLVFILKNTIINYLVSFLCPSPMFLYCESCHFHSQPWQLMYHINWNILWIIFNDILSYTMDSKVCMNDWVWFINCTKKSAGFWHTILGNNIGNDCSGGSVLLVKFISHIRWFCLALNMSIHFYFQLCSWIVYFACDY